MIMSINGHTRTIGLIGNPVEHTLSPIIHNGISEAMGISSTYVPFKVKDEGLEAAVRGAYELNILGLNVTVPYKNRVIEYLCDIDEAARNIGAVNTLVRINSNTGYKGYNTDMLGLLRQLHEDDIKLENRNVVVLGAGGAARAVVYMCLLEGASRIYILNRTLEKAIKLAEDMKQAVKSQINAGDEGNNHGSNEIIPMCMSDYERIVESDIIVFQATSIGLAPNVDDVVINDPEFYKKIEVGIDLIYNPANTRFMQLVTLYGGKAYNALKMLLYQGVIAYELWHDIKVPDNIITEIYTELKRNVYPKNNVVLIGFMGSGKTTVGKQLARRLSMEFVDTDKYIEDKAGMKISEIFDKKGEAEFRRLETEVIRELKERLDNTVLSTGGGMPLRFENAGLLKEIGKVFYLTAADQVIYERVKNDSSRPLLQADNPYGRIRSLLKDRRPLYEKACDVIIDTNSNDLEEVVHSICNYLK